MKQIYITHQLTKVDILISIWKLQDITPYGHLTIVKTFLIFQLIYKLTLLSTVKVNTKELENKLDSFVWDLKDMLSKRKYYMHFTGLVD